MTVINNATLILKDKQGNEGIVKSLTDNDIDKISNAITDVGQVVDPATHMPIEATTASVGVVQLATAQDITNGTAGKVVDAKELSDAIADIKLADSSKFSVVAGANIDTTGIPTVTYNNGTFTFNYLKGAKGDTGAQGIQGPKGDKGDTGPQGPKGDTPDSIAWDNVSGKPSSYVPSSHTHDDRYYTESEIDTKLGGKADKSLSNIDSTAKEVIAHNAMPSNEFYSLTVGASSTYYTAPADGFFMLHKAHESTEDFVYLATSTMAACSGGNIYGTPSVIIPVKKSDSVYIEYSGSPNKVGLRFVYAVGSESERV